MTYSQLADAMSERELAVWAGYRSRNFLPHKRLEMHIAQLTAWVAKTMGGIKNADMYDFVIEFKNVEEGTKAQTAMIQEEVGFAPRIVKKKRKG